MQAPRRPLWIVERMTKRQTAFERGGVNTNALSSAVLSVLWIWGLGSLLGALLGHLAKHQIRTTGVGKGKTLPLSESSLAGWGLS